MSRQAGPTALQQSSSDLFRGGVWTAKPGPWQTQVPVSGPGWGMTCVRMLGRAVFKEQVVSWTAVPGRVGRQAGLPSPSGSGLSLRPFFRPYFLLLFSLSSVTDTDILL